MLKFEVPGNQNARVNWKMIAAIFSSPIYMSYLVIFKPATIKSIIRLLVFLQCEDNLFLNIRALLLFGCRDTAMDRL